ESVTSAAKVDLVLSQLGGAHRPPQQWLRGGPPPPPPGAAPALGDLPPPPLGVLLVLCNLPQPQRRQLQRQRIPSVVVDTDSATAASVPTVGSNNWSGGPLATRPPPQRGHR